MNDPTPNAGLGPRSSRQSPVPAPYGQSLALLTDLYELTMAYGYWKSGMAQREAVFHLTFRHHPFRGGFTIAAGLGPVTEFLEAFRFDESDRAYLAGVKGTSGEPLFEPAFIEMLGDLRLACDLDAVPEGTAVFPNEPLLRVRGPLLQCQIIESALLNILNFQSLIATKAARVCAAARGEAVLEFGLRRAQGIDGALAASRAAYLGGCAATSNVLAGKLYGIPVRGTHAHSWVMSFATEEEAFRAYAEAMPENCIFLVDTYDTLDGVRRAIEVGQWLREQGHEMLGIRLDSGDLAGLSIQARTLLDEAGFPDAVVVGSGDLDEHVIADLNAKGAAIGVWGVGTRLVTAHEEPSLSGIYKISAIRDKAGNWEPRLKVSEEATKTSNPGILQVRRFEDGGRFTGDVIYDELQPPPQQWVMVGLTDASQRLAFPGTKGTDLLIPVFREGRCIYENPSLEAIRQRVREQLAGFDESVKRLESSGAYPLGLEESLFQLKKDLLERAGETTAPRLQRR